MNHRVYLILGGNMGEVRTRFAVATMMLTGQLGSLVASSPVYQSDPWGMASDDHFFNQVLCLESSLHPLKILKHILRIEQELGRKRTPGLVESRPIDIDILFIDEMIISEPGLEVPHPRLHLRRFALQPMVDIAPGLVHPIFGFSMEELLLRCEDPLKVIRVDEQTVC